MVGRIVHKEYQCEYMVYGSGDFTVFAFHGFDNLASQFEPLSRSMGGDYRIVAINLFFHGASEAHDDLVNRGMKPSELLVLFDELKRIFPSEKYALAGYSLGGRIALSLTALSPESVKALILLSPDGLRISPFYTFLTRSRLGRGVFARVQADPSLFFRIAALLRRTGLVNRKKYEFALSNFNTPSKRKKVYDVWMIFRFIRPDLREIARLIREYNIRTQLFFGKYDTVIPASYGDEFLRLTGGFAKIEVIEAGHRLLRPETLEKIGRKIRTIKNDAGD
jgi:pimeloyl-ACP methyl ester carboxylesterase